METGGVGRAARRVTPEGNVTGCVSMPRSVNPGPCRLRVLIEEIAVVASHVIKAIAALSLEYILRVYPS